MYDVVWINDSMFLQKCFTEFGKEPDQTRPGEQPYDPDRPAEPVQEESKYRYFREEGDDLVLNFGKHRGRTVDTVIAEFPDYVDWALSTRWDNESMGEEVQRVFNEAMGITADRDKPKPESSKGTMPRF